MKFHWGHGVGILYLTFVVSMLFLVYKTTQENFGLVTDDYYKEAIQYQSKIDKQRNSAALAKKLTIDWMQNESKVRISFPENLQGVSGEILLYRPSDSGQDLKFQVQPDSANEQEVSFASLKKGLWRVQVEWKSGITEYFDEKLLLIQ